MHMVANETTINNKLNNTKTNSKSFKDPELKHEKIEKQQPVEYCKH